jgi:hypothetical protein
MDLDPIKQLQGLLEDRDKVLEKISSIQAALGSLRTDSTAPEAQAPPAADEQTPRTANPFFDTHAYDRLLQSLRAMQAQIEDRVRPLAQQAIECEVARLREQSTHQQTTLDACLAQIDQCIVNCMAQIDHYRNQHALLISLNEQIVKLGGTPKAVPDLLLGENTNELIEARVAELRKRSRLDARL